MPYFSVILHGIGINIPSDDGLDPIIGFFTTRIVRADSIPDAENKAKDNILSEWASGLYAKSNNGMLPVLAVEEVSRKKIIHSIFFKNKGYSFYCHEK